MQLDLTKAGSTTLLFCGKTNVGHYASVQQGLNSFVSEDTAKPIFDCLIGYAPVPPGEGWSITGMEMKDYRSWERGKYYKIDITFHFSRGSEKYSNVVRKTPGECAVVYDIFSRAVALETIT